MPLMQFNGHKLAVRKVKWSPHSGNVIASVSYDMTMRLWDTDKADCFEVFDGHREFTTGVDFNLYRRGLVATCGWDEIVYIASHNL